MKVGAIGCEERERREGGMEKREKLSVTQCTDESCKSERKKRWDWSRKDVEQVSLRSCKVMEI